MDTNQVTEPTAAAARYIVVDAPGYYGDETRVVAAYDTLDEAIRKATHLGSRVCVRGGHGATPDADGNPWIAESAAGDRWLKVYEQGNPILFRKPRS